MLAADQASGHPPMIIALITSVLVIHLVVWATLRFSLIFVRLLGNGGVTLLTKLAGMLLAAIAVQLIINGVLSIIDTM